VVFKVLLLYPENAWIALKGLHVWLLLVVASVSHVIGTA
jgi:hypothetical protein